MDNTNIFKALSSCHFKLVKILLDGGSNVNVKDEKGITPLMKICHMRIEEKVKLELIAVLLRNNVDLHLTDSSGRTALMYAIHSKALCVVQLLKRHGLTETVKISDKRGRTLDMNAWNSVET